ncbi:thioredoxin fold domain-containing protein [Aeromonas veronii]|uniref:thioredoxin fold domain-containing protein n=1 Tax=Aeromonas veronii TaxID=654 RepID=UPI00217E9ABF|nr:thioredoxin fold domain-containing protein [Aeromonas veronii]
MQYGQGQKRLFLFSAIDCPACKALEDKLSKAGASENTTFFVIPSSLQDNEAQWQRVSNIWCANDSSLAWKKYWATGSTPVAGTCLFHDGHIAKKVTYHLWDMLKGAGLALHGTPAYVREDGLLLTKATLNLPLQPSKSPYWLAGLDSSDVASYWPQPVGNRGSSGTPNGNNSKKINVGEALKGLLSK